MSDNEKLLVEAETIGRLEIGVRGTGNPNAVYPDWVYEARDAIRHQNENLPWLPDLLRILGWQGGTVHAALRAVHRLVESEKRRNRTQ